MNFKLKITVNGKRQEPIFLTSKSAIIGRGSKADIKIITDGISRTHLLLERSDDTLFLTDLESSNGTKVGDQVLKPNEKFKYDTYFLPITLGQHVFIEIEEVRS